MTGAGTVDLESKTLTFRVEPKLVMTTEGQGGNADPVGLGIPVIVQGAWKEPRIYPDVTGILDDRGAAYAKLRELGQGLFGQSGLGRSDKSGIGETLGNMISAGSGRRSRRRSDSQRVAPCGPAFPGPIAPRPIVPRQAAAA